MIGESRALQDYIVLTATPETATFASAFQPLTNSENERFCKRQYLEYYAAVSTGEIIRNASEEAETPFFQFDSDTALPDDLHRLLAAVHDIGEPADP